MSSSKAGSLEQYQQAVEDFPSQFAAGLEAARVVSGEVEHKPYRNVVVCGVGGSGLGGDLLNAYLDPRPDIVLHKAYDLPNDVTEETLVIAVSYSGNTEETLSAAKQAVADKRQLIIVTGGGVLKELAEEHDLPIVNLSDTFVPRLSAGIQIGALYGILAQTGVITDDSEAIIEAAAETAQDAGIQERAAALAGSIGNKIALIYAGTTFSAVARNWKTKINETAKAAAFWNVLPELQHNEINALVDRPQDFHLVLLQDESDHPRVKLRQKLTRDYAQGIGMSVSVVQTSGSTLLARLLGSVWLGDWVSLELARIKKQDPAAIPAVDKLKKALGETS